MLNKGTGRLLRFFLLTFAVTWTCFAAAGAISSGNPPAAPGPAALAGALLLLGTFAPGLIALALTGLEDGRAATRALLGRVFGWNVGARWYLFAVGYMPAVKLSVALLYRLLTGAWPRFGQETWYVMAGAIMISTWAQAGEEIGWRGYALPRLSDHLGLAPASVVLGIVWAIWHLPLFFFPAADTFGQSFAVYLPQVTALSAAMAWLYWRTGGSLLLVMLLHASVNNTKDIVPSAVPGAANPFTFRASLQGWLTVALMWICATYFLVRMRKVKLQVIAGPVIKEGR